MNLSFVKEKFVGIFEKGLLDELEKLVITWSSKKVM
jgi:hypothetical protein